MEYKLLLIDGDGTLLSDDKLISDENIRAIQYAKNKGVNVVICSGRSYATLKDFAHKTGLNKKGNFIVAFNGCLIFDAYTGEIIDERKLPFETSKLLVNEIKKVQTNQTHIVVYDKIYSALTEQPSKYILDYQKLANIELEFTNDIISDVKTDIHKILMVGEPAALREIEKHVLSLNRTDINVFFSFEYLLEFTQKGATKGNALKYLANKLDIPLSQTMAIGDQFNDMSMITESGLGVAMANSIPQLKKAAGYISSNDNNNSGVAEAIYKFI